MRIYDCFQHLPYAFEQVSTVFWQRYPNPTAKHIMSEDFIEVVAGYCNTPNENGFKYKLLDCFPSDSNFHVASSATNKLVDGDQIRTKKLILKQTGTFLKAVPKWMSRLANIKVVPTVEESIYDRSKRMLVTYTRNIAMMSTCKIHERCVYKPALKNGLPETVVERGGLVTTSFGRFNSLIERVLMSNFKKSMKKTRTAYMGKLLERFGEPALIGHGVSKSVETNFMRQKLRRGHFSAQD